MELCSWVLAAVWSLEDIMVNSAMPCEISIKWLVFTFLCSGENSSWSFKYGRVLSKGFLKGWLWVYISRVDFLVSVFSLKKKKMKKLVSGLQLDEKTAVELQSIGILYCTVVQLLICKFDIFVTFFSSWVTSVLGYYTLDYVATKSFLDFSFRHFFNCYVLPPSLSFLDIFPQFLLCNKRYMRRILSDWRRDKLKTFILDECWINLDDYYVLVDIVFLHSKGKRSTCSYWKTFWNSANLCVNFP